MANIIFWNCEQIMLDTTLNNFNMFEDLNVFRYSFFLAVVFWLDLSI